MHTIPNTTSSITDAIWSFDLTQNRYHYLSPLIADIFEIPVSSIEANPLFWVEFIHPDDYQYVLRETEKAYRRKQSEVEYRIIINNQIKWVRDRRTLLLDEDQNPTSISGVLSDITNKKETEEILSSSELTFRYLFINNPNPLWIYDTNSLRFLDVNHAAIAKYGFSKEEFLEMTIADIRPEEDVKELIESVKKVEKKYLNASKVWRHLKKNREIIYVNVSGHGIRYKGKSAEIVMAHDVTDQVYSKQEITVAKESLDALINNIEDQIWSIDSNYNMLSANIAFRLTIARMTGREMQLGESVFFPELLGKDAEVWKGHYDRALAGEAFQITELINYPDRNPFFAETKFSPIIINEKIVGVACTSRNIQERLETQRRIIEQNRKLLELISIVSHEIRGPVASILGLTDVFNTRNYSDPFNAEVIKLIRNLTTELDKLMYTLIDKTYDLQQTNQLNAPFNKIDQ